MTFAAITYGEWAANKSSQTKQTKRITGNLDFLRNILFKNKIKTFIKDLLF
jgi:hypothetical protein